MTIEDARQARAQADRLVGSWRVVRARSIDIAFATRLLDGFDLTLRMPDAIHVAIATRLQLPLVTFDHGQFTAARASGCVAIDPLAATDHPGAQS